MLEVRVSYVTLVQADNEAGTLDRISLLWCHFVVVLSSGR